MGNVTISLDTVPSGTCYQSPAIDWPILVSLLDASIQGTLNTFNYGTSTPAAADRDKPWFRVNADGTPDNWYVYSGGYWLTPHPVVVGLVTLYEGALVDLPTFDGGENTAVSLITGPFWEEVTAMAARSPMHPGTLPSGALITIGVNSGEETHVQTVAELVAHSHPLTGDHHFLEHVPQAERDNTINRTGSLDYKEVDDVPSTGGGMGFNVVHPVRGIYFIRRTARRYRRI